jgi:23S rRNA pseudouridine1911/1915/1917 synthase
LQRDLSQKIESIDFHIHPTYKPLPIRCDVYLTHRFNGRSRNQLQKLFQQKRVFVNDKVVAASFKLRGDEQVRIMLPKDMEYIPPEKIDLDVVFEDEEMMIINKSPGLMMHPAGGVLSGTLLNAIHHYFEKKNDPTRPGLLQRLDKHTSGLLLVAKTKDAHAQLQDQILGHDLDKIYLAFCHGCPKETKGYIEAPLDEVFHPFVKKMGVTEQGKHARTQYQVLATWDEFSMVGIKLHTGRQHQIRVHFSHIGHPLLGDTLYEGRGPFPRQALHSYFLRFEHPKTQSKKTCFANCPEDIQHWLKSHSGSKVLTENIDLENLLKPWDPLPWIETL